MDLRKMFAAVALALCLLPLAAAAPLLDPDEGLHAAIAQEMVVRHDYVTPTFLGQPFLDKPILFFWAEAFSLRAFGMRETAVRVPPILFGLLGMLGVALLGRAMIDEATGLFAGIVYGTMLLPASLMEIAVHDVALTPFLCAGALAVWRTATRAGGGRAVFFDAVLCGASLGLSILTKGLVGVAFVGLFFLCVVAWRRDALPRLFVMLALAGVVTILVALPWYLLMERAHPGYLYYYFVQRHLEGYLTATQRHSGRPWWYYVPVIIGGALPWIGFVPAALRASAGRAQAPSADRVASGFGRKEPSRKILWLWFALGFVFLSLGESKLATYVLPTVPPLAIVIASVVVQPRGPRWSNRLGLVTHTLVLAALPSVALYAIWLKWGDSSPAATIGSASAAGLVVLLAIRTATAESAATRLSGLAATTVVGLFATVMLAAPQATPWMTARDLAETINSGGALPPRVLVLDERIGSLVFYLSPALRREATPDRVAETTMPKAIDLARIDGPDWLLATRGVSEAKLRRSLGPDLQPDARAGTFVIYRASSLRRALHR